MLKIRCPHPACRQRYSIREHDLGKSVRCQRCFRLIETHLAVIADPTSSPSSSSDEFPLAGPDDLEAWISGDRPVPPASDSHPTVAPRKTVVTPRPLPPSASAVPGEPEPDVSIGRFLIQEKLGQGAFGTVFRARDPQLDREVAIKVLRPEAVGSPDAVERFFREAKAAARLNHPHIVPVYDTGSDRDRYYIASAFVAGKTLSELVETYRGAYLRIARLVKALAQALQYAHEQGVIHRDVKPQNILIDSHGAPHILDFGLAHTTAEGTRLTHDGMIIGTPAYMAPEQAAGIKDAAAASDQYSLGVVLYELLTGDIPFRGPPAVVLYNILNQPIPAPHIVAPGVPSDLETICLKALSRDPAQRYSSLAELAEDLGRWEEDRPISARPLSSSEKLRRWCRRNPAIASLTAAVVVSVGVGMGSTLAAYLRAESLRQQAVTNLETADSERKRAEANLKFALEQQTEASRQAQRAKASQQTAQEQAALAQQEAMRAQTQSAIAEQKTKEESLQRMKAEASAAESEKQKLLAMTASEQARTSQISDARRAYLADMRLTQQAWEDGDLSRFRQLVAKHQGTMLPDGTSPRGMEYQFWLRHSEACALALKIASPLTDLKFLQDETLLAAASAAGQVVVWNAATGQQVVQFSDLPPGSIRLAEFAKPKPMSTISPQPEGEASLLVACADGTLRMYNQRFWDRKPYVLPVAKGEITSLDPVDFNPQNQSIINPLTVTAYRYLMADRNALRWVSLNYRKHFGVVVPYETGQSSPFAPPHPGPVFPIDNGFPTALPHIARTATFSDPRRMSFYSTRQSPAWAAVAWDTGQIVVWGYSGELVPGRNNLPVASQLLLQGAAPPISHLEFINNGRVVVAIDGQRVVKYWRLEPYAREAAAVIPCEALTAFQDVTGCVPLNDTRLAIGRGDGSVAVHEWGRDEPAEVRRLHPRAVTRMQTAAKAGRLAAASHEDGQIFLWTPLPEVRPVDLDVPKGTASLAGCLSKFGNVVYYSVGDEIHRFSENDEGEISNDALWKASGPITSLSLTSTGDTVVAQTDQGEGLVVSRRPELLRRWTGVRAMWCENDTVTALLANRTWQTWSANRDRDEPGPQDHPTGWLQPLTSPQWKLLEGGPIEWTCWTRQESKLHQAWTSKLTLDESVQDVVSLAVKPGMTAERIYWRKYWRDLLAGTEEKSETKATYRPVVAHPDGQSLVVGGLDPLVRFVAVDGGQVTRTFRGHTALVSSLCLNRDGTRLISGDIDGAMILWDVATAEPLLWLQGGGPHTAWIQLSGDERFLAAGGLGWARRWQLSPDPEQKPKGKKGKKKNKGADQNPA